MQGWPGQEGRINIGTTINPNNIPRVEWAQYSLQPNKTRSRTKIQLWCINRYNFPIYHCGEILEGEISLTKSLIDFNSPAVISLNNFTFAHYHDIEGAGSFKCFKKDKKKEPLKNNKQWHQIMLRYRLSIRVWSSASEWILLRWKYNMLIHF